MQTQFETLEAEALKLTTSERAKLAEHLIASPDEDSEIEEVWATETTRRIADIENGTVQLIPAEEAIARARSALMPHLLIRQNLLATCLLLGISNLLWADEMFTPPNVQTLAPATSRYEIVQSQLAAKWTFRIDKYCGRISQLVKTKDDDVTWEAMPVLHLPKCTNDPRVHFQIFSSGLAARHTYLLNVDTGRTWVLSTSKDEKFGDITGWTPFTE